MKTIHKKDDNINDKSKQKKQNYNKPKKIKLIDSKPMLVVIGKIILFDDDEY